MLDAATVRACIQAGAQFVVSPALDLGSIDLCRQAAVAVMPGALTPTEGGHGLEGPAPTS